MHRAISFLCGATLAAVPAMSQSGSTAARPSQGRSVHGSQVEELGSELEAETEGAVEARSLGARGLLFPDPTVAASEPVIGDDFVVFGYLQGESQVFHTRWHALTHVGSRFVGFDGDGSLTATAAFTGRSSYLRAGGAADAAGVKVILVVANFDDSPGGDIERVMTDAGRRANLAGQIAALLAADDYAHGVSMDLEFSWGATVRDGVTAFMGELRAALDAVNPELESSIYTNAIFSANQWDFDAATGITPHIDYMLYSMYDWATGLTAHAISDFDNCLGPSRMHAYLNDGLPPEKLVLVVSAYSRRWTGTSFYNGTGTGSSSSGFTDALYDVTINTSFGGPYAEHYVAADECGWYTWNDGTDRTRTWEAREGLEYKIQHALSLQDPAGVWNGRRLRGVGFWSLFWMAETSSYDPRTASPVSRTRTYPHVYQLCQELLSAPARSRFLIDGFEGLDFRWRDPNEAPDTAGDADGDSSRALVLSPAGPGAPASTRNAMQLSFDFESAGSNAAVLAHEVLASPLVPGLADVNATAAHFDATTTLFAHVHTPAGYRGYGLRMLVVDGDGELEASGVVSLDSVGWRQIEWDLTDAGQLSGYATNEPAFASGDGVLDTARAGARDVSFFGFVVEGTGAAAGAVVVDELGYVHRNPGSADYVINELRYSDSALEFVEIYGPAGALPGGLELRFYDSSDGSVLSSVPLAGFIPDERCGGGFYVVGDPAVPNVDLSVFFDPALDDIPNLDPSAVQLYSASTGCVYDSLVYEAYGGLDDLVRAQTQRVTSNGYPWVGEVAGGSDAAGTPYSIGRYPDGADTRVNAADFSFMPASPGEPNGQSVAPEASFDFELPPSAAFQTFQSFSVTDPTAVGLPPSPSGGRAYRCVDTAGGGVIGVVGDAALGHRAGHEVTGELYVPTAAAPPQALAVGVCGRQGSRFFTGTLQDRSAYESGYWLIYENRSGVALADGRPDHPGVLEFVHATHDNMDGDPVTLLGSLDLAATGAGVGAWTSFTLIVEPAAPPGRRLVAQVNGVDVYRGDLPTDGPTSGGFQIGFRENHPGPPAAAEGTWVDRVAFRWLGPGVPFFSTECE